jgi:hypothetical protein
MRTGTRRTRIGTFAILAVVMAAVAAHAQGGPDSFEIVSPDIEVAPGEEASYCYYFRTPNVRTAAISLWSSELGPAIHSVKMFLTTNASSQPVDKMPPGTLSTTDCGVGSSGPMAHWVYAAETPLAEVALPGDDGNGTPVASEILPNAPGFLKLHVLNATASPVTTQATVRAEALNRGVRHTPSGTYITYDANINIAPLGQGELEGGTCATPPGAQFWRITTHAHKQAVETEVLDNVAPVFESTNWEQPGAQEWAAAPFFTFASSALTYRCTYNNPTSRTISAGDSAATDEHCMAIGHFFPACLSRFCVNNFVVPSSAPCDLIFGDGFQGA